MEDKDQPITPEQLDAILETIKQNHSKIIWTASAIGARIGRSEGYVRKTLVNVLKSPVKRDSSGNFYALECELIDYFKNLKTV